MDYESSQSSASPYTYNIPSPSGYATPNTATQVQPVNHYRHPRIKTKPWLAILIAFVTLIVVATAVLLPVYFLVLKPRSEGQDSSDNLGSPTGAAVSPTFVNTASRSTKQKMRSQEAMDLRFERTMERCSRTRTRSADFVRVAVVMRLSYLMSISPVRGTQRVQPLCRHSATQLLDSSSRSTMELDRTSYQRCQPRRTLRPRAIHNTRHLSALS